VSYSFHPEAEQELEEAAAWYEEHRVGLGVDFLTEIYGTIHRIVRHPMAWPPLKKGVRRALVHRFPYGVLYGLEEEHVFIVTVMHLHRRPGYWQDRIG